ncbi:hypothetical protein BN1708_011781 [Verticillium longisporum]|uniref:Uncharacterized protein n=1 Tax=Verticillium longisporum TaxID=100787 RepID=A0A0G4L3A9_VERLO|nr:hypothetical protein BN1708_011781 [Verticillium longisporum]
MESSNQENFFETDVQQEKRKQRALKQDNPFGNPIRLPSKVLAVLPDPTNPNALLTAESSGRVARISLTSRKPTTKFAGPAVPVTSLATSGTTLFAGAWDKTICCSLGALFVDASPHPSAASLSCIPQPYLHNKHHSFHSQTTSHLTQHTMDDTTRYHGTLVSLEGPVDVLATQLRLLPTSPQIFILPQVQTYLEDGDPSERFEARNFIRRMHNAVAARNEVAYSFLKDSTPANKRLVFMNGSTPGAQAICIKTIAEHETDGDISHAELLFNDIVKHGAAGLEDDWFSRQKVGRHHIPEEDPIVRAMRAAEALDRLTADLQPNTDVDLTFEARPRSMSLPIYSFDDRFGDAAPFYVFGVRSSKDDDCIDDNTRNAFLPATPRFAVTDFGESLADTIATFEAVDNSLQPLRSPSCVGETYEHQTISPRRLFTTDMLSPRSGHSIESTDAVVYGEASLMQMQMANARRSTKRTKSLDRAYQTGDSYWDSPPQAQSQAGVDSGKALSEDGRRNSNVGTLLKTSLPRTIHVRCDRSIVLLSPPPPKPKKKANGAYVDKGTDAEDFRSPEPPFRPVLPFTEDLVIKIQDGADDNVLEATISAFKAGIYPIQTPEPSEQLVARKESVVKAPKFHGIETAAEDSVNPSASVLSFGPDPDEYDPFAYGPTPLKPANTTRLPLKLKPVTPPTPAHTPSSLSSICGPGEERFQSCDIAGCKTAIAVQNSLRVLLNVHFPPEDQGYHHFHFSILPEMGGLWKPVFRNAGAESPRNSQRRIDQILALEKLGVKSGEVSRSGRLDFRYLVANAMQAFTAQPLANQTHENPFTNPYLLATLIVPHLEPYFVIHNEPCVGIQRMRRWERANKLGLNPPIEVLAVLLKEQKEGSQSERAHMDVILNSTAVGST